MTALRAQVPGLLLIALIAGCAPDARRADVTMHRTTQPASPQQLERRVDLTVRDAGSAALADSLLGRDCRIRLRRDALGMAGTAPGAITGTWANQFTIEGRVVEMTDQWLVVSSAGKRYSIAQSAILLIEHDE